MQDNNLDDADIIKARNTVKDQNTKTIDLLVQEVLSLNPKCTSVGEGKLNRLIELAKEVEGGR